MFKFIVFILLATLNFHSYADVRSQRTRTKFEEEDGDPSGRFRVVKFSNDALIDHGDGTATVNWNASLNSVYIRRDGGNSPTANISWDSNKITDLTDPTNSQDAATKEYVDTALGGIAFDFFLSDTADGSFSVMFPQETGDAQSTDFETITSASLPGTLIEAYITETSEPTFVVLTEGVYTFHFHGEVDTTTGRDKAKVLFELWQTDLSGVDILKLMTSEQSAQLTTTETQYEVHAVLPSETLIGVTDRLVLKVYGILVAATGNPDPVVTITMEGTGATTTATRISIKTDLTAFDDRYVEVAGDTWTGTMNTDDGSILATAIASGTLTFGGIGGTYNENLTFDFDVAANQVDIGSGTGVDLVKFSGMRVLIQESSTGQTAHTSADDMVLESSGNTAYTILSGAAYTGAIVWGDTNDNWVGSLTYTHTDDSLSLATNDVGYRFTVDTSGNCIVRGSSAAAGYHILYASGAATFNETGASVDFRVEGNTEQNLLFVDGSTDRVGIGTATPGGSLEIYGGGINALRILGGTDTRQIIGDTSSASDYGELRWDTSSNYLGLDADGSRYLVLQEDGGNVGIGTTSPNAELDVKGTIRVTDPSSTRYFIEVHSAGGVGYIDSYDSTGNDWQDLVVRADDFIFEGGGTERFRITDSGNVGIGEVAPQDKLEVNGTGLFKDKLKFTQDDGNEYIDSGADNYVDIGATTAVRINSILQLVGVGSDPTEEDGMIWYRSDLDEYRGRANGITYKFMMTGI